MKMLLYGVSGDCGAILQDTREDVIAPNHEVCDNMFHYRNLILITDASMDF